MLAPDERRDFFLSVRITQSELKAIERAAEHDNMNIRNWARSVLTNRAKQVKYR